MNERIRLLAEQAKTESSQWLGSKPATTITYDELEKFAELIVRECAGLCSDPVVILQHFGLDSKSE
jgi:3'-phosphoadenosine 5'-phosphosulfate sulfotransferase (PAPS reductase)/FAD synthetase